MTAQLSRLGAWLDWDDPYMTLDRKYMESVWYGIKRQAKKASSTKTNRSYTGVPAVRQPSPDTK